MKNHKAACTNVLTLLITHMHHALGSDAALRITMDGVHNLSPDYLRAGARGLDWATATAALTDPGWFRFTILRHPFARTVSAWADKLRPGAGHRQRRDLMTYLGRDADAPLGLSEFLDILAHDEGARDLDRHWRPQHREISHGLVRYDLIGRVEAMEEARRALLAALFGVAPGEVAVLDTREHLGHRSESRAFLENLSAEDRRNLERAFERDLEIYEAVAKMDAA